jgi:SAM-dependent methyltransferase
MAHQQQREFCESVKKALPHFFSGRLVLDVGSLDINGNNQYLFDRCLYLGVDLAEGRNVDLATMAHELKLPNECVDVVISTECFEHDQFYESTLNNIVRMLKPGGLFLFSCATSGRPEHGTRRTKPEDSPFTLRCESWADYYKNLEERDIRKALNIEAVFADHAFSINHENCDLYFWGIKRGTLFDRDDYSFRIHQSELLQTLSKRDTQIAALGQLTLTWNTQILALSDRLAELQEQLGGLLGGIAERDRETADLRHALLERDGEITGLKRVVAERDTSIARLISSRSWRLTKPLRFVGRWLRGGS